MVDKDYQMFLWYLDDIPVCCEVIYKWNNLHIINIKSTIFKVDSSDTELMFNIFLGVLTTVHSNIPYEDK